MAAGVGKGSAKCRCLLANWQACSRLQPLCLSAAGRNVFSNQQYTNIESVNEFLTFRFSISLIVKISQS